MAKSTSSLASSSSSTASSSSSSSSSVSMSSDKSLSLKSSSSIDRRKRLAANARERKRMHLLNKAYDELRRRLADAENKSKYDVLVQAKEYIQALATICEKFDQQHPEQANQRQQYNLDAPVKIQTSPMDMTTFNRSGELHQQQQHQTPIQVQVPMPQQQQYQVTTIPSPLPASSQAKLFRYRHHLHHHHNSQRVSFA